MLVARLIMAFGTHPTPMHIYQLSLMMIGLEMLMIGKEPQVVASTWVLLLSPRIARNKTVFPYPQLRLNI